MSPFGTKETKEERPAKRIDAPVLAAKPEPPRRLVAARDFSMWTGKVLTHYPKGSQVETDPETQANLVRDGQAEWR